MSYLALSDIELLLFLYPKSDLNDCCYFSQLAGRRRGQLNPYHKDDLICTLTALSSI